MLLEGAHCRHSLMDDLIDVSEFDIVGLEQVDVICFQAAQRLLELTDDGLRGEVEMVSFISPAFGGKDNSRTFAVQSLAEPLFREGQAIVGRNIEKVDAILNGALNRSN